MNESEHTLENLRKSIEMADLHMAEASIEKAIKQEVPATVILKEGVGKAMSSLGKRFDMGEVYLPQLISSSKVAEHVIEMIPRSLYVGSSKGSRVVVIGTVKGDIHSIGKDLCVAMLRGAGYEVVDMGTDVSEDDFIEAAHIKGAKVIAASALMTTTLNSQRVLVRECKESESDLWCFIGGGACSEEFCREIGADGYSSSAIDLVTLCDNLELDD